MEKYQFGMKAEKYEKNDKSCFTDENVNPYGIAYFDQPENMAYTNYNGRITSIPSPYARMHITDLAFKESNCGYYTIQKHLQQGRPLSDDYMRAMSHCLDIYELIFNADKINLQEKGLSIQKLDLVSTRSQDPEVQMLFVDAHGNDSKLKSYIETLELFRDEYVSLIRKRISNANVNYNFDFSSLYLLKHKNKTFAATSPFTGFFAKADCDLSDAELVIGGRRLLTADPKEWKSLGERSQEFRDFMYVLLHDTYLSEVFTSLYKAVEQSLGNDRCAHLKNTEHITDAKYKKFNINQNILQGIAGKDGLYIRPDGLDCSYLQYLLYLKEPVNLSISQEDYQVPVDNRCFPTGSHNVIKWIGINDILSDGLFVFTYDICDQYKAVSFTDLTDGNKIKRRCLIPIKEKILDYFTMDELIAMISIVKYDTTKYSVSIRIPLDGGGKTILRREYYAGDGVAFPNGVVVEGEPMKPFAFGIYPFIKATNAKNIYKVLFYNSFESAYSISFFRFDNEGRLSKYTIAEHTSNRTNSVNNDEFPFNCEYHNLEATEGLDYAKVDLEYKGVNAEGFIVPLLKVPKIGTGHTRVAIDLGTSNTYMAYQFVNPGGAAGNIEPICTHHETAGSTWNELTFMNKPGERADLPNADIKNLDDLYLKTSDRSSPTDQWLSAQLNEFIPSRIDESGYQFPIPTVINFLRINELRDGNNANAIQAIPLVNTSIPFAYYERGIRKGCGASNYYDAITDGSEFKWFANKDKYGNVVTNSYHNKCLESYIHELLFIVRSHLLSRGYRLDNCSIVWSYPLSFDRILTERYKAIWEAAFKKYIYDCDNPYDAIEADGTKWYRLAYTNESRSPIFYCMTNFAAAHNLHLLMDIGGGSTDVIGYKADNHGHVGPIFITSFGFAGNALYLGSSMNIIDPKDVMRDTILARKVEKQPLFNAEHDDNHAYGDYKISLDRSLSELMNYGFTKRPQEFARIFDDTDAAFLLKLHNCAIIYHVAQLCCKYSPDTLPHRIFLTGNGSKLLELTHERNECFNIIFKYVYKRWGAQEAALNKNITIEAARDPKKATVNGALNGLDRGLELNENSRAGRVVMLGDAQTAESLNLNDGGATAPDGFSAENNVLPNVREFIDMFYSEIYKTARPYINKEQMLAHLDTIKGNAALNIAEENRLISDSIFFQYIALLLEEISLNGRNQ